MSINAEIANLEAILLNCFENHTPEALATMEEDLRHFRHIQELWEDFGDVPMDPETETIDVEWNHFPIGTHKTDIWHWFEDQFNISVAEDLMYEESKEADVIYYYRFDTENLRLITYTEKIYKETEDEIYLSRSVSIPTSELNKFNELENSMYSLTENKAFFVKQLTAYYERCLKSAEQIYASFENMSQKIEKARDLVCRMRNWLFAVKNL